MSDVEIIALRGFMLRPGHPVRAGERVEVPQAIARSAIAYGNAREATRADAAPAPMPEPAEADDDDGELFEHRDPAAQHRDPTPRRRKP
jgi:hypothetical protein